MNKIIILLSFLFFIVIILFIFKNPFKIQTRNINTKYNYSNLNYLRNKFLNKSCNIKNVFGKPPNERTIYVSIASYRDDDCPNTIKSLLENSGYPNRIYLGICQQNTETDIDCIDNEQLKFNNLFDFESYKKSNIRIKRLHAQEAKGPTYARYLCSLLYNEEDYYLQIDSHMLFNKDWDIKLINYLDQIYNKNILKAVITYYPKDWSSEGKTIRGQSTFCKGTIGYDSQVYLFRGSIVNDNKNEPREVAYCSANFFFTYGCFLNEIPYDPNLPQLFEGEEPLFTVRLWTSGWNFYSPPEDLCYHFYIRKDKPKYWDNPNYKKEIELSLKKVRTYLGMIETNEQYIEDDSKIYGLGSERTLIEYWNYIGFDREKKVFNKNFC
jgi:hypothetical protein